MRRIVLPDMTGRTTTLLVIAVSGLVTASVLVGIAALELAREAAGATSVVRSAQLVLLVIATLTLLAGLALAVHVRRATERLLDRTTHAYQTAGQALGARREMSERFQALESHLELIERASARLLARPASPRDLELIRVQNAVATLRHALSVQHRTRML